MADTVTIRVSWDYLDQTIGAWNELLAWTVETYGLPGDRVSLRQRPNWMDFIFKDENDALMFQLRTGGERRYKEDYTTEFVGQLINGH
jgi:hypothetical protein